MTHRTLSSKAHFQAFGRNQTRLFATREPDEIRDLRRDLLPKVFRMVEVAPVLGSSVEWLVC